MTTNTPPGRVLEPGQRCQVWIADAATGATELAFETTDRLLEAPNWSPDGASLLLNGDGLLWRLDLTSATLVEVPFTGLPPINNDHVLDGPRRLVYLSANDWHIYRGPVDGGEVTRVTPDDGCFHFLHGVSPDGGDLAYVEISLAALASGEWLGRLAVLDVDAGAVRHPDAGTGHLDGPEYSPDGGWLYLNSEHWAAAPGHAQLGRVPVTGGEPERLVASGSVDWFPHLSPDAELATYISFPAGTLGHPENLEVELKLVRTADWTTPLHTWPLFGGQGTINVNSWAPDSHAFAFVAYPLS